MIKMYPRKLAPIQPISQLKKMKELARKIQVNKYKKLPKTFKRKSTQEEVSIPKTEAQDQGKKTTKFEGKIDKELICQDLLKEGYAQAFTDFLYITHGMVPKYIEPSHKYKMELENNMGRNYGFVQSETNLLELKEQLKNGDQNVSEEEYIDAIDIYMKLASIFTQEYGEYHVSAYLYQKCMKLANLNNDPNKEALAEMGYAKCHDLFDKSDEAIENLEKAISKAQDEETIGKVSAELIVIYRKLAEKHQFEAKEFDESIQTALDYYEKCLIVCRKANQKKLEGKISHKIGKIYFKYKMFDKSIANQKTYLAIIDDLENTNETKKNRMEAHAALAQSYMGINDNDTAMEHVKAYQRLTENQGKNELLDMKADAERHLANLYWKKGDRENALKNYKAFFQDAKNDKNKKDRRLVDNARISLGLAKGTHNIDSHLNKILQSKGDIYSLINWKFKKDN